MNSCYRKKGGGTNEEELTVVGRGLHTLHTSSPSHFPTTGLSKLVHIRQQVSSLLSNGARQWNQSVRLQGLFRVLQWLEHGMERKEAKGASSRSMLRGDLKICIDSPGWYSSAVWPQAANRRVAGSISSQGTCLGCRPGPQWGATWEATKHWRFSPFLPPFPHSLKINK